MTSPVLTTLHKLQSTETAIQGIERELAARPNDGGAALSLKSLVELRTIMRNDLATIAAATHQTAVDIRLFAQNSERLNASIFATTISSFQRLFSLIFEACRLGIPLTTFRISSVSKHATSFTPALIYPGSLGVVMTLPVEKYLTHQVELSAAAKMLNDLLSCRSSDEIFSLSKTLGRAPIVTASNLASAMSSSSVGTEVRWFDEDMSDISQYLEPETWKELSLAIAEVGDQLTSQFQVHGYLVAGNVEKHKFELRTDEGEAYAGSLSKEYEEFTLGRYYTATIEVTSSINVATGESIETYHILSLEE